MLRKTLLSMVAMLGVVAIPGISRADDNDHRYAFAGNWNDQFYRGSPVNHRHNHFHNNRGFNDRYRYQSRYNGVSPGFQFGFSTFQPQPYLYNPVPVYRPAPVLVPAPVYRNGCW
jgi:hypothetical protein